MSRTSNRGPRSFAIAAGLLSLLALGADPPPVASLPRPTLDSRQLGPTRPGLEESASSGSPSSGGWWIGTAGIAVALAVFGGVAAASRRFLPNRESTGSLRVVGRVSLSAKQAVYLVRAGDRVLILGGGSQGPPTLLGEMNEPAVSVREAPLRPPVIRPAPVSSMPQTRGFDQRIGDDE